MNRRKFITAATAASGLLILKSKTAFGYQANSAVRLGLLGCGDHLIKNVDLLEGGRRGGRRGGFGSRHRSALLLAQAELAGQRLQLVFILQHRLEQTLQLLGAVYLGHQIPQLVPCFEQRLERGNLLGHACRLEIVERVEFQVHRHLAAVAGERSFHELQQVRAFLKMLGLGAEFIKDALRQLTAGRSASVPNVSLTDKAVKSAGFGNLVNLARSNG